MQYFGGKSRISKRLSAELNGMLSKGQPFVDMFCGACNVITKICPRRIRVANDIQEEIVALMIYAAAGGSFPSNISEEEYRRVKSDPRAPMWYKGFAGFGCSFAGKLWGGYARSSVGRNINYCMSAKNSLLKKAKLLQGVRFSCADYREAPIPEGSLIYCDIPYKNSTGYASGGFDHEAFYDWARARNTVVSEYLKNVPSDARVVWETKSKMDIRSGDNSRKPTTEVLFRWD